MRIRLNRDYSRPKKAPIACAKGSQRAHPNSFARAVAEALESRLLLSAISPSKILTAADPISAPQSQDTASTTFINLGPISKAVRSDVSPNTITGDFTPSEIRTAYGVTSVLFGATAGTGAGQTIAIVDAYNDPDITTDANNFSSNFGLTQFNGAGEPTLKVLNETGGTSLTAVPNSSPGTWDLEESLDVEWAHSIAPSASIILFEANSNSFSDLLTAVETAAGTAGVSVVSNSWSSPEFSGENSFDSDFTTPVGHQGVTFLASAGDSGAIPGYPSESPNVISVGGTTLQLNSNSTYLSESAWSGSGGGLSAYESQPSYQTGKVSNLTSTVRATPDVSMVADPNSGVQVLDTYYTPNYLEVGGTSLACPLWAGTIALVNQGRALNSLGTLNGLTQTLPDLYSLSPSYFHDVITGNNGQPAGAGYDLATGLGSPIENLLVPALAGFPTGPKLAFATEPPSSIMAGNSIAPIVVDVETANGTINTSDNSNVSLTIYDGPAGTSLTGTTTVAAVNGVATFNTLSLTIEGQYTLEAGDSNLYTALSNVITVSPNSPNKLAFTQQPNNEPYGVTLTPAVAVAVEDTYGNIVTTSASTIVLSLTGNPVGVTLSGSLSSGTSSGLATFSNLSVNVPGSYTLTATDSSLSLTDPSNSFLITTAQKLVFAQQPTGAVTGTVLSPALTVDVEDQFGNLVTGDGSTVTMGLASGTPGALAGKLTALVSGGVATFSNLSFTAVGSYSLSATDPGLTSATSNSVFISGPAAKLVFTQQPMTTNVGAPVTPSVVVSIEDQFNNVVTSDTEALTISLGSEPVGGALSGPLASTATNGVATFTNLWLNESGTFTLSVTDGTLTGASNPFAVTGSYGLNILAQFNDTNGEFPIGEPTLDSAGNLYGTTQGGGQFGYGTIFKIAKGASTLSTLASFNYTDGAYPWSGLTLDSAGDIFGLAGGGGTFGDGAVFEIVSGSTTITTLASFNGTNGNFPRGELIFDGSGNLYGTSYEGGADGTGDIFEVVKGSGTITNLASFTGTANGSYPTTGLVMDSSGNLYGVASEGGTFNEGDIFELAKGAHTITQLVAFNGNNGGFPQSRLVIDSSGDLFGSDDFSNPGGFATVFELPKGATAVTTLVNFGAANVYPQALVMDASGNLFGITNPQTTATSTLCGTVFEIVKGATTATTLVSFDGVNGYGQDALVMDASGNLFGFSELGGTNSFNVSIPADDGFGNVFELQAPHLVFTRQPSSAAPGAPISPSITVTLENPFGSTITSDNSAVNMTINTGTGSLAGSLSATLVNGVATFNNLSITPTGTYTLKSADGANSNITVISSSFTIGVAPQITNVTVDGTAWSPAFLTYLAGLSTTNVNGYSIPVGSAAQLNPLPWTNINQINITFSENVDVTQTSLQLVGVSTQTYSFTNFAYNSTTDTATWTLTAPIAADRLLIDLSGSVTSVAGAIALNGAWTDTVSTYPSGGGTPGTAFLFSFDVLPGDAKQTGQVTVLDTLYVNFRVGSIPSSSVYSIFADVDGNATINILDVLATNSRIGAILPSETPTVPSAAEQTTASVLNPVSVTSDSVLQRKRSAIHRYLTNS